MKRIGRTFITLVAVLTIASVAVYGYRVANAITPTIQPHGATTIASQTSEVSLAWPGYGQAAIGALGYGVLATHGDAKPLATASVAKIITALCILEKHPLAAGQPGPTLTLTQQDVDLYFMYLQQGGSLVGVANGEQISEYQALEAMLLPSGNNMADTLANWAFGSQQAYLDYANQYVAKLGMTDTHVGSASGFQGITVSTARDLVLLGEAAMQNPVLAQIVSQKTATVPVAGVVHSTNILLGQNGIVGIKTGNNDQDKGAYLFASKQKIAPNLSVTFVGVVMDASSLWQAMNDSLPLINSAVSGFSRQTVVKAGDIVGRYSVPWLSGSVPAVATHDLTVLSWESRSVNATVKLQPLTPPVSAHQTIGKITITSIDGTTQSVPITLQAPIPLPNLQWRLLHP